jgi:hypothetical protein
MAISTPESPQERQQRWADLESDMDDFLVRHDATCDSEIIAATCRSISILEGMSTSEPARVVSSSRAIVASLAESIRVEESALRSESSDLDARQAGLHRLEDEASSLRLAASEASSRRREVSEVSIPLLTSRASERIAEIDEVKSRHVKDNGKIARELGFHAILTNITWDYGGQHARSVLAGEVSIPGRAVHRRFAIDRRGDDAASECEIAERLWETIGG